MAIMNIYWWLNQLNQTIQYTKIHFLGTAKIGKKGYLTIDTFLPKMIISKHMDILKRIKMKSIWVGWGAVSID